MSFQKHTPIFACMVFYHHYSLLETALLLPFLQHQSTFNSSPQFHHSCYTAWYFSLIKLPKFLPGNFENKIERGEKKKKKAGTLWMPELYKAQKQQWTKFWYTGQKVNEFYLERIKSEAGIQRGRQIRERIKHSDVFHIFLKPNGIPDLNC